MPIKSWVDAALVRAHLSPMARQMLRWLAGLAAVLTVVGGAPTSAEDPKTADAVFAAGCFWCVEEAFEKADGVIEAVSGFAGGDVANPSYYDVVAGGTGHAEAVKVVYDPSRTSYGDLLNVFWLNVDPLDGQGQFCDRGASYRPALFPSTRTERLMAERSIAQVQKRLGTEVAVAIEPLDAFYPAEDYHQDYYDKNPLQYRFYKWRCGRQDRLEALWGRDPEDPLDVADLAREEDAASNEIEGGQ